MPRSIDIAPPEVAGRETKAPVANKRTSLGTPLILVVRHGSVSGSAESGEKKILRGQDVNDGLSSKGRSEISLAADKLVRYGAKDLWSSGLKRGKESAAIIGEHTGLKPKVLEGLKPWKLGPEIAGKHISEVKKEVQYYQDHPNEAPPGGEPYAKYYEYTVAAWKQLMKEAENSDGPIIATAHSRDILALPNIIAGKGSAGIPVLGAPANGSISELRKVNGKWQFHMAPAADGEGKGHSS